MPPRDHAHLSALAERAGIYAADAKAACTLAVYRGDFDRFSAWCDEKALSALPTQPMTVAMYLASLADEGLKASTIERALVGIGHAHRVARIDWRSGAPEIKNVVLGIRRRLGVAPARKAPLMDTDLRALVRHLDGDLAGHRDRAILTLGWFGAFRRSELVGLRVDDVAFTRDGLVVRVRKSKTDPHGAREVVGVPHAADPSVCAVRSLRTWLEAAGIVEGALFRSVRRSVAQPRALDSSAVMRIVKAAATRAGIDPTNFAAHSLRAGFATTAASKGKSLEAIMRQTRHRSERVARGYVRPVTVFADNAASGLA
jgi:integrase